MTLGRPRSKSWEPARKKSRPASEQAAAALISLGICPREGGAERWSRARDSGAAITSSQVYFIRRIRKTRKFEPVVFTETVYHSTTRLASIESHCHTFRKSSWKASLWMKLVTLLISKGNFRASRSSKKCFLGTATRASIAGILDGSADQLQARLPAIRFRSIVTSNSRHPSTEDEFPIKRRGMLAVLSRQRNLVGGWLRTVEAWRTSPFELARLTI